MRVRVWVRVGVDRVSAGVVVVLWAGERKRVGYGLGVALGGRRVIKNVSGGGGVCVCVRRCVCVCRMGRDA